jgi:hypothetical protein
MKLTFYLDNTQKGILISGMGEGLEPAIQGLAASFISKTYTARMFTIVTAIDMIAQIIGGPMVATLYAVGQRSEVSQGEREYACHTVAFPLSCFNWVLNTFIPEISFPYITANFSTQEQSSVLHQNLWNENIIFHLYVSVL